MTDYIHRCSRCSAPNNALGSMICAACRQIESIENASNVAMNLASEHSRLIEEFNRENAQVQAEQQQEAMAQNERNARLSRQQAVQNAKLAAEGGISYESAYQYGLNYLDGDKKKLILFKNVKKIDMTLHEDGSISCVRDTIFWQPFEMEHLNHAFDCGLAAYIKGANISPAGKQHMLDYAYNAGVQLMPSFYIPYLVVINERIHEFATGTYTSNFARQTNLETGQIEYFYDEPFNVTELNEAYVKGVWTSLNGLAENTPDKVDIRMRTEVAEILAARNSSHRRLIADNELRRRSDSAEIRRGNFSLGLTLSMIVATVFFALILWREGQKIMALLFLLGGIGVTRWLWCAVLEKFWMRRNSAVERAR
jgi:hypothetical protein